MQNSSGKMNRDASWNDYFCIYLTEGCELYGVGLNDSEVLLGEGSESQVYSVYDFQKVTEPVLVMTDVAYARAGRECIVAHQNNKTAYWWGQYAPLTHTYAGSDFTEYWKLEEDVYNPLKTSLRKRRAIPHMKSGFIRIKGSRSSMRFLCMREACPFWTRRR